VTWKAFEELIALIQKQTAPSATVTHDHRIMGRSGRLRQLDVTLSTRVGLHDVLIAIECKHSRRRVGIESVEAFATKLRDVNASQGAMISEAGFDAGAQAAAGQLNIGLWTYREAVETDWRALLGPAAWMTFQLSTIDRSQAQIQYKAAGSNPSNPRLLLDAKGNKLFTIDELRDMVGSHLLLLPPGEHVLEVASGVKLYVRAGAGLSEVEKIWLKVTRVAREYIFNLRLASGHVLQGTGPTTRGFKQVHSEPFQIEELQRTQQGRELSVEEWKQTQGPPPPGRKQILNHIVPLSMTLRLDATYGGGDI
jgi:hypothetical protein